MSATSNYILSNPVSDSELTPRPESDAAEALPWSGPSSIGRNEEPYPAFNDDAASINSLRSNAKADNEQAVSSKAINASADNLRKLQNVSSSGSIVSPASPSPSINYALPRPPEYGLLPGAIRSTYSVSTSGSTHTTSGAKGNGAQFRASADFMPSYAPSADPATPRPLILNKFVLYENKRKLYVVATGASDSRYRMLRIDRTSPEDLSVTEDEAVYTDRQIRDILRMLEDGNKVSGGLNKVQEFHGIVGE
jgi:hypothetical protein